MNIILSAQLTKVASKADRTYNLQFNTQELGGEYSAELMGEIMNQVWLVIARSGDDVPQAPEGTPEDMIARTPSQRLRAIYYLLWKQSNSTTDFDSYYATCMERIIDQLKEQIND